MTARLHFLFALAPLTLSVIAWIGAGTALFAAVIALTQNDIKKVLAYSTISQLGYMFLAAGMAAFGAAIFHVFTHAFFKACLFLGSGSVIHALGGEQDMRKMGGLKSRMPITYWTYLIAALAIAGAPFTAGFFSKDLILWEAFSRGALVLWGIALITAGMTAFYMFRQLFMVFHGECRADDHAKAHLHESPGVMTLPLIVLAIGAIFSGWLGAPEYLWGSRWEHWLEPLFGAPAAHESSVQTEIFVTVLTLVVVALGIYFAYKKYGRAPAAPASGAVTKGLWYQLSLNKFYVDEIYDYLVVRPFTACSRFFAEFLDPRVIDGAVNGVATIARALSWVWCGLQTGNVQHYATGLLVGTLALLAYLLGQS
jgi:NADH-quinone oxidoreductase subunit L